MKRIPGRKKLTLITLVLALGVAVYLNWEYAKNDTKLSAIETGVGVSNSEVIIVNETNEDTANKNYGDAQLVSLSKDSGTKYFDEAKLTRSKTRDEALDKLQKTLKSAKISEAEKKELTASLSTTIDNITAEGDIENLIKAKGFVDCVAFINDDKANIAVMTKNEGLSKSEVAQIRDIVISKATVDAKNITVVEVK
ncbi:MAG: SpoIIIAH-like family protein [Pygmaiobacter sp.]